MYGNHRYKLLHTRKILDTVGLQKVEEKNNQFLIEKIILVVEFENSYQKEKKPEILETIEGNYKVARRVWQYLYFDIADLFLEYVKSMDSYEIQDIEEDMKANGWGAVEKISEVNDSFRMLNLFQDFYTSTGRLPAFNRLLVVPDGDASENSNKINMKSLYDLFKNTKSHGLVSLPLLGLLLHFFESKKDLCLIKNATTEFYENLSYDFKRIKKIKFKAVSEFIAQLPFIIKGNTVQNIKDTENENIELAKQINTSRVFEPTISDPLDDVMEILDMPEPEHKKTTFPYVEPTVELSTRWNRKLWKKNQRWLHWFNDKN